MANTFLTATTISSATIAALRRTIVLPRLVTAVGFEGDQRTATGDTFTVRVKPKATARRVALRTDGVARERTMDSLTQVPVAVQLTDDVYHMVPITDEELTLDGVQYAEDVAMPQAEAVAENLEDLVATTIEGASFGANVQTYEAGGDAHAAVVDLRAGLNDLKVPMGERILLAGSEFEAELLKQNVIREVDSSGTDDALREAIIGRLAGFTVVPSTAIASNKAIAFHRSAFALATVVPGVPEGAVAGGVIEDSGVRCRWIRDYDPTRWQDRSAVDLFAGAAETLDDGVGTDNQRAIELTVTQPA